MSSEEKIGSRYIHWRWTCAHDGEGAGRMGGEGGGRTATRRRHVRRTRNAADGSTGGAGGMAAKKHVARQAMLCLDIEPPDGPPNQQERRKLRATQKRVWQQPRR
eukprot:6202819-Pleurochrysis_carterae.AAC.3